MGFRFWRRIRIAPGVTLNLSKSGGSLSFGPRGAKFTVGRRGGRATVGVPGTGLFYTTATTGRRSGRRKGASYSPRAVPTVRPEDRLTLGFFKRLVTPAEEEALVDGCREMILGHEDAALARFEQAVHLADGAYLAGFLALTKGRLEEATGYLIRAAESHESLGGCLSKYGISATMSLPITDEVSVHAGPDLRGVLLGLVEAYQRLGRRREAVACLERLQELEPADVVVKLSLAELLLEADPPESSTPRGGPPQPAGGDVLQRVVRLAEGIENETPVHAALLLYKARALRGLGLLEAARETLTGALRRSKGRSGELLQALRYERALVYEELGQRRRARSELEKLYSEAPDYEDVAARLGIAGGGERLPAAPR
ncbi:MAG: DUF4236 domain-containing protein [Actinobacteria bacterium]|nr:DUF4236 domain-containing protein [Actinomycetota bacterium]